jgi:hypothetical protein
MTLFVTRQYLAYQNRKRDAEAAAGVDGEDKYGEVYITVWEDGNAVKKKVDRASSISISLSLDLITPFDPFLGFPRPHRSSEPGIPLRSLGHHARNTIYPTHITETHVKISRSEGKQSPGDRRTATMKPWAFTAFWMHVRPLVIMVMKPGYYTPRYFGQGWMIASVDPRNCFGDGNSLVVIVPVSPTSSRPR